MNKAITIRDLQKLSAKAIEQLDGPTPLKSGERTIGAIFPLKKTDPRKLKAILLKAEKLAGCRNAEADDVALSEFGPVDKTDWSFAAIERARRAAKRKK